MPTTHTATLYPDGTNETMPQRSPFSDAELKKMYSEMLRATPWLLRPPAIERGEAYRTVVCEGRARNKERDLDKPLDCLVVQTETQVRDAMGASTWQATDEPTVVGHPGTIESRAMISWLYGCWLLRTTVSL